MFPMKVNTLCARPASRPTLLTTGHVISNYTTPTEGQTTHAAPATGGERTPSASHRRADASQRRSVRDDVVLPVSGFLPTIFASRVMMIAGRSLRVTAGPVFQAPIFVSPKRVYHCAAQTTRGTPVQVSKKRRETCAIAPSSPGCQCAPAFLQRPFRTTPRAAVGYVAVQ